METVAICWLLVAVALTIVSEASIANRRFDGEHAWNETLKAQMARSFAIHGILGLHGIPVQNNPPLTDPPDAYLHWPPGLPVMLSVVFRIGGESELSARLLMLANLSVLTAVFFFSIRRLTDSRIEAAMAAFAFLTLPVVVTYGSHVTAGSLATTCIVICALSTAMLALDTEEWRRWIMVGTISLLLGVSISWITSLVPIGVLFVGVLSRDRRLTIVGLIWGTIAACSVAAILGLYLHYCPSLGDDLWNALLYRLGVGRHHDFRITIHTLVDANLFSNAQSVSLAKRVWRFFVQAQWLGQVGFMSLLAAIVITTQAVRAGGERSHWGRFFLVLLAPWATWQFLMTEQAWHNFVMIAAAPAGAVAMSLIWSKAGLLRSSTIANVVLFLIIPAALLLPRLGEINRRVHLPDETTPEVLFAREIERFTPAGSIVLTPDLSTVTVYYSKRHTIRGVQSDAEVLEIRDDLRRTFPKGEVFLAIRSDRESDFARSLASATEVRQSEHGVIALLRLERM